WGGHCSSLLSAQRRKMQDTTPPATTQDSPQRDAPRVIGTLLVTGSRSIGDAALVFSVLDALPLVPTVVMHGGAAGVDTLAGKWAKAKGYRVEVVRPPKPARPGDYVRRDYKMVDAADQVVAIWDGHSPGTRHTFEY